MHHPHFVRTLVATVFALLVAVPAAASQSAPGSGRIVNGLNTHDFSTTGALMFNQGAGAINANNADSWCSGTLIGCNTFLTAAHCVEDDQTANKYWVFLQHAGVFAVDNITMHPSYTSPGFPEYDIAVVELSSEVTGIDPTELPSQATPNGTTGTIAGFGQTSGSAGDYGIKRQGQVETSSCTGVVGGLTDTELVCWTFTNPVGPAGDDSNTCNGDSGGPLFADLGNGEVVVGVTSGGNNGSCLATDNSYDSNVFTYKSFVTGILGSDSTSNCGSIPPVGDADVDVIGNDGNLSGSNTDDTIVFSVPSGAQELRVALKGEDNGSLNVDYYVKAGLGAGPGNSDCSSTDGGNVAMCTFASPAAGDWSVFVERGSGSGEYQVTATIFGGDPPVCGDNVRAGAEECDGTDDDACMGLCQVDCTCPAPVCGNDVIESGEECDGTSTGSCPTGACDPDCTCPDPVCGNDITETGEECDGTDDSACPGECDTDCTCIETCNIGDLQVTKGKADVKRFSWKAELDDTLGTYDAADPRDGFSWTVDQSPTVVTVSIPAADPGWDKSRPDKGRYKWKGELGGLRRVKLIDKSDKNGFWKVIVKGKEVPGAGDLDVIFFFADIEMDMGGICAGGTF